MFTQEELSLINQAFTNFNFPGAASEIVTSVRKKTQQAVTEVKKEKEAK